MPTVSAARGCSPTPRSRSPTGVLKRTTQVSEDHRQREPDEVSVELRRGRAAEVSREECQVEEVEECRAPSRVPRRSLASVDVDEQVPGDPEREEVDRRATDDLVGPQVDREEGVEERERCAGERRADEAERPVTELVGAQDPEERPHRASSPRARCSRRRCARRRARRWPRRRAASRSGAWRRTAPTTRRPGRGCRCSSASRGSRARSRDAGDDGSPADPPLAARSRADADRQGEEADYDRHDRVTTPRTGAARPRTRRGRRGSRQASARAPSRQPREQPLDHPLASRLAPPLAEAEQEEDEDVGADEEDDEPLDDERQVRGELGQEDLRIEVPRGRPGECGEEQSREADADRLVPAEQRDGDTDEADRRRRKSFVLSWNFQPRMSIAPASPANMPEIAIARK